MTTPNTIITVVCTSNARCSMLIGKLGANFVKDGRGGAVGFINRHQVCYYVSIVNSLRDATLHSDGLVVLYGNLLPTYTQCTLGVSQLGRDLKAKKVIMGVSDSTEMPPDATAVIGVDVILRFDDYSKTSDLAPTSLIFAMMDMLHPTAKIATGTAEQKNVIPPVELPVESPAASFVPPVVTLPAALPPVTSFVPPLVALPATSPPVTSFVPPLVALPATSPPTAQVDISELLQLKLVQRATVVVDFDARSVIIKF